MKLFFLLLMVVFFSLLGCGSASDALFNDTAQGDAAGGAATDATPAETSTEVGGDGLKSDGTDAVEAAVCKITSPMRLFINEVRLPDADAKDTQFIELLNAGACPLRWQDFYLQLYQGREVTGLWSDASSTFVLAPGEHFIVGNVDFGCQTEKKASYFVLKDIGELRVGYCPVPYGCSEVKIIDRAIWSPYDVGSPDASLGATKVPPAGQSMSRSPDGQNTGDPSVDFAATLPSPCAVNNPPI